MLTLAVATADSYGVLNFHRFSNTQRHTVTILLLCRTQVYLRRMLSNNDECHICWRCQGSSHILDSVQQTGVRGYRLPGSAD